MEVYLFRWNPFLGQGYISKKSPMATLQYNDRLSFPKHNSIEIPMLKSMRQLQEEGHSCLVSVILNLGDIAWVSVSNFYRKLRYSSRKNELPNFQSREGERGTGEEQELVFGKKCITEGKPPHRIGSPSPHKLQQ